MVGEAESASPTHMVKELMSTQVISKTRAVPNFDLREPPQYKVIYINDDVTTVDFVMETLMMFFAYTFEDAQLLTQKIHDEGSGVAAVLPYELAEHKGVEVTKLARSNNFPLNIKLEPAE
jgi:ATP-dependent Clp protease adaptor protein ClpS